MQSWRKEAVDGRAILRPNRFETGDGKNQEEGDGGLAAALRPSRGRDRLELQELHCTTVRHSVGLHAADAVYRRLSGRFEMALRLLALQLSIRDSRISWPHLRSLAETGRRRRVSSPERKCRPHQASDWPAGGHRRGARRRVDSQWPGGSPASPTPCKGRNQRQQPVSYRA